MDEKDMVIDAATHTEVIDQLIEKLRANYIFPEIAERICDHLRKTLQEEEYDDLTDGNLFALGLTIQLQEISHDEHLWVRWHDKTLPKDEALRLNPTWREQERMRAQRQNYGIYKLKKLPGNVGYVDFHYLHRPEWAGEKMVEIMQFIASTGVAIIDLRKCTGGYPHMITLICSYLFHKEPTLLFSIYWRDEDATQQYWTLPYVPNQRFPNKPIYLLTSRETFSGGEALAEILQSRKRATIIGEKTDGGSHIGASYNLHPHFEAFISIGRMINPLKGSDWEGTGITPDIIQPAEQSFSTAYKLALQDSLSRLGLDNPRDQPLRDEILTTMKGL